MSAEPLSSWQSFEQKRTTNLSPYTGIQLLSYFSMKIPGRLLGVLLPAFHLQVRSSRLERNTWMTHWRGRLFQVFVKSSSWGQDSIRGLYENPWLASLTS